MNGQGLGYFWFQTMNYKEQLLHSDIFDRLPYLFVSMFASDSFDVNTLFSVISKTSYVPQGLASFYVPVIQHRSGIHVLYN